MRNMEKFEGRVALVTGASAGIGAAIVKSLLQSGMIVIGAARRLEKMQEFEKDIVEKRWKFIPIKCDLEKDEDIYDMFDIIEKEYGGVDILVNNAAKIHHTNLLEGTPEIWRSMMNLNLIAVALCSKLAVKSMRKRGVDDGHIVMISSDSAYKVHNYGFVRFYCGTKFALRAYTLGLRQEMKELKYGIKVSTICPGAVDTEIWQQSSLQDAIKDFKEIEMLKCADIASSVLHVLETPKHVEITKTKSPAVESFSTDSDATFCVSSSEYSLESAVNFSTELLSYGIILKLYLRKTDSYE